MGIDWNLLLAATLTSLLVSTTPGPNNIICAAIGARYGYRRAVPYALGVAVGFPVMLAAVGLGLGAVIRLYPQIQQTAQILGALFLAYLAYRIAIAPLPSVDRQSADARVLGFGHALLIQWVNPKAVSFSFSLIALYARPQALALDVLMLALMSVGMALFSTMLWALTGDFISRFLQTPLRHRVFNCVMALLLLSAAASIFFHRVAA